MSAQRSKGKLRKGSQPPRDRASRAAVLVCFLLSGAASLAYEILWVRMLTLVFGATVLSVGSVLAAFMTGLALGSWYWCRRSDASPNPLRLYAFLELGIALSALVTPLLFHGIQGLYRALFVGGLSDFTALSLVRFFLCLPVLVLPTFLMGGTLPVLARYYTTSLANIGRGTGDLYGVNTAGAVAGTVLTGFLAIPTLGVHGTLYATVAVNLLVAGIAYALSTSSLPAPAKDKTAPASTAAEPDSLLLIVLVGFGISGFAAMIYEVAWTRALVQVFGNSTYAFTTMLSAFLVGIALGSAVSGRFVDRARHLYFTFGMIEFLIGVWAAAATPLIECLPPLFLRVYDRSHGSFASLQALQFITCCLLMLPTTMGLGAVFPVVTRIYSSRAGGVGKSVGFPYSFNTFGTVLGSLTAGFFLVPRIGIELPIVIGGVLNLLVWGALLACSRQAVLRPRMVLALGAVAVLACGRLAIGKLDPQIMAAGVYMYPEYFLSLQSNNVSLTEAVQLNKVLYHREGYASSIAVLSVKDGSLALQANGKTDASTGDLSSQRAIAHLPMLMKPEAKDVLVVGLASGCTAGSVLLHPVERVDCAEIEPAMLEAARYFDEWNHQCLADARLHLLLQDARNYVMMSDRRYDVITAEPTNPWIAGVNNLFTLEYYRDCRALLKPSGIMCQWIPAYNFTKEELRSALATFSSAFPYVTVWSFPRLRTDFFALGSVQPLDFDLGSTRRRLARVREDLKAVGTEDLWHLMAGLLMDEQATRRFCKGAPLNTDENPIFEYSTPRHLHNRTGKEETMEAAYSASGKCRLTVNPQVASDLLRDFGVWETVPTGIRVTQGAFVPYHPRDLTPFQEKQDKAEFRVSVTTSEGPATLRMATLPRDRWPGLLERQWPHPSNPLGSHPSNPLGSQPSTSLLAEETGPIVRVGVERPESGLAMVWEVPASSSARMRLRKLCGALLSP
ncbi:MAG: fused MFS/spermidine synthase [Armatimonadetes bacterium]|nr:fused MFS/spermidine synthase [Armatimonadota bacterium]